MAVPFASSYAPINLLNDAIMSQAQQAQAAELARRQMDNQGVSEAMNRIVQQRAIQQQSENQRAHYGLQQQQLANDLAYRNAALKEAEARSIEQARQFDAQFGLNKKIAEAQLNNPFYGQKDALAFGLQAGQDVAAHNAAATAIASQATGALAAARAAYKAETDQIKDPAWYQSVWRHLPAPTATQQDLLNASKARFDATVSKIMTDLGPHRDKVSFEGTPDVNGVFKPVLLNPPTMPGMQPKATVETPKVESGGTEIQPDSETPDRAGSNPFSSYVPPLAGPSGGTFVPAASPNPFLNSAFMQQIMTGKAQGAGPAINFAPAAPNRALRFNPATGLLVPLQ